MAGWLLVVIQIMELKLNLAQNWKSKIINLPFIARLKVNSMQVVIKFFWDLLYLVLMFVVSSNPYPLFLGLQYPLFVCLWELL